MTEDQELELVEQLAEEFTQRCRRGERPTIKEFADRHPELAEIIRDTFQALALMEDLAPASDDSFGEASPNNKPALGAAPLDHLGDYRIIREVGRGGMGIVYEAEQVSLGRHVAVKVLPKELLQNPKHRSRFEREAKAAAKLHHTNIVPVFGVGEENGTGYYVMQFIQGLALDEVLDELKRMKLTPGSSGATAGIGRVAARRSEVSAADVARSLMEGTFEQLAVDPEEGLPSPSPEKATAWEGHPPVSEAGASNKHLDETMAHEPHAAGIGPPRGHPASGVREAEEQPGYPPAGAAVDQRAPSDSTTAARLSETFSLSSASDSISGSSSGTHKKSRKFTYWQSVAQIGVQVAEALHYAHGQGVLHRDIKPSNLLLDLRGTVWVTDFGLAKLDDDRGLTQTGDILGTLRYLAPETLKQQADARSEVYSLGLTLYEMLALRPAVEPTHRHAILDQVLNGQVEPLDRRNAEIPRDLATIVHKAIERDPRHRYSTAQELADDLRRFVDDEPIHARRLSTFEHVVRWSRHNRGLAASLAAVATLVCVLAVLSTIAAGYFRSVNGELSNTVQSLKATQVELHDKVDALDVATREARKKAAEAEAAEAESQQAEKRSREFRYATDMQLAAMLVADETANATQITARLADHDPAQNKELADKQDLRGFEWHYLKNLMDGRATVISGIDGEVVDAALNPEGELVTLDGDGRLQHWSTVSRRPTRPALDLKQGRDVTAQALSHDGRSAALGVGNQVHLVDATTGEENPRTLPAQTRCGLIFSPDDRLLITVDTEVAWWTAATGKPIARQEFQLAVQGEGRNPLSVSADGLTLAVGGQGAYRGEFSVFRVNRQTREIKRLLDRSDIGGTKRALAISPDGETVAVSLFFRGTLYLCEAATGKLVQSYDAHTASISDIAFSVDGRRMVTAAMDGSVKVWDDYRRLKASKSTSLLGHAAEVDTVAFVAGGNVVLSSGKDKTLRLWKLEQSASSLHRTLAGARGSRGRFSPDGTLLALSNYSLIGSTPNKRLQLRDGTTGEVVAQLPERGDELGSDSVAFSPDNRLLAAGFGGKKDVSYIELWDIARRERLAVLPGSTDIPGFTTSESSGMVPALAFSPDGKHLVAGFGSLQILPWGDRGSHPLLVYDLAARRVIRRLEGHRNDCVCATFSRDGLRMASASYDGTARIWDAGVWKELHVLNNPDPSSDRGQRRVCDVAFSPDGKLLAMASAEGNVILWDATAGEQIRTLSGHSNEVWCVAFAPNGRTLASGSHDGTIRLWNTATWRELVRLDPPGTFAPTSLAFSPDGTRLLAASHAGEAIIWSVQRDEDESGPTAEQFMALLSQMEDGLPRPSRNDESNGTAWEGHPSDFASRIRMFSENPRLHEALEKLSQQRPDDQVVQAALAATRANWHASRQEWKLAVEQFDLLRQLKTPTRSASEEASSEEGRTGQEERQRSSLALRDSVDSASSPDVWLRAPGLLRLATALFYQDRPAEAAALLTGGEHRRAEDGNATQSVSFGFRFGTDEYPFKLSQVFRGSPAWQAGLCAGDLLLKVNDTEVAAENFARLSEPWQNESTVRLTVQRPGQGEPQTLELTKAGFIQDDVTNLLIDDLLAAVNQKLAQSPQHPGLLEVRAELAGQSSDYERQVADYTAAIEALSGSGILENSGEHSEIRENSGGLAEEPVNMPEPELSRVPLHLQRLHCRRGNAYFGLEQWQSAVDDYAKGITDQTHDENLLANQALSKAQILAQAAAATKEAFVQLGREDQPHGIALVDYRFDGVTEPATMDGKDCRCTEATQAGFGYVYFRVDRDVKWAAKMDAEVEIEYCDKGIGSFGIHYDSHDGAYQAAPKYERRLGAGGWKTARFGLTNARFANSQNGGADFRIAWIGDPLYVNRAALRKHVPGFESDDPWVRLAAAFRLNADQQAIDEHVGRRPEAAGAIGDLFTQGEDADWRRAVEIYSKGIGRMALPARPVRLRDPGRPGKAILHDSELLAKRARAYEELKDWAAAAADWQPAAGDSFEGAKLLADFAGRLTKAGQRQLAATIRQQAANALEETLAADPGDDPATAALAALLLDQSDPDLVWTALKPAVGAARRLGDDFSISVEPGTETVTLPDTGHSLSAVRIETSPDTDGAADFKEYQVVSTRLSAEGFFGQYVRIDLPGDNKQFPRRKEDGDNKSLALAEVQVFDGEQNLARSGRASQSTTGYGGDAQRAIDGNTSGDYFVSNSITHTSEGNDPHPWWEVDLGDGRRFNRIVIWNRSDDKLSTDIGNRLNYLRVRVLDASRNVVFEQLIAKAPNPSLEINRRARLAKIGPDAAGIRQWQLRLDAAGGLPPCKRLRLWMTDDQPMLAPGQLEASNVTWTMPLPEIPESAKAVRVETGADEYRVQALGSAEKESGASLGRYVYIDLPGDNKQFPRLKSDGEQKVLTLAEVQVFQGDRNVAPWGHAHQSTTAYDRPAQRALDGDMNGAWPSESLTHTLESDPGPSWEVDLGSQRAIDRLVVWNRTDGEWGRRLRHFRVRILDASRNVVFERVIDPAPSPSREIVCRSFLVERPSSVAQAGGTPTPQEVQAGGTPALQDAGAGGTPTLRDESRWALVLGGEGGGPLTGRLRISAAERVASLEEEEAHAHAQAISLPAARLAAAYDLNHETAAAANWFARALDRAKSDADRQPVLQALEKHPEALAELLKRRSDDALLQLALARSQAAEGQKKLTRGKPAEALADLQKARAIFTRLLDQNPEPEWTVLKPTELKSEGGATLTLLDDGSVLAGGKNPDYDSYTLTVETLPAPVAAIRLDVLTDQTLPSGGPGRAPNGRFVLTGISVADGESTPPPWADAFADHTQEEYDVACVIGKSSRSGWAIGGAPLTHRVALFAFRQPWVRTGKTARIRLECRSLRGANLGRFRLSAASPTDALARGCLRLGLPDREIAALEVAIGKAHAQRAEAPQAAAAFARALDRAAPEDERKKLIEQFQDDQAALATVAPQRPHDLPLQLALARSLAESGKKSLADGRQDDALAQLDRAREVFARLLAEHPEPKWTLLTPFEMTSQGGATLALQADGSVLASGVNPDRDAYTLVANTDLARITAVRLEALPDPSLPQRGPGRYPGNGNFHLNELRIFSAGVPVELTDIAVDYAERQEPRRVIDGNIDSMIGWENYPRAGEKNTAVIATRLARGAGDELKFEMHFSRGEWPQHNLGRFRLSVTDDANALETFRFHRDLQASGLAELAITFGRARGREGRSDEAAAAFAQALDLAADREDREKILNEASAYEGVLDKLAELRVSDVRVQDALARHDAHHGRWPQAHEAAIRARALYEQWLATEPTNSKLAQELADLLLDVSPVDWVLLEPSEIKSEGGATLTLMPDRSILAGGKNPDRDVYNITARTDLERITAVRLEALPDPSLPNHGPGRCPANGNFHLYELRLFCGGVPVPLTNIMVAYDEFQSAQTVIDGNIDSGAWANALMAGQKNRAVIAARLDRASQNDLKFDLYFDSRQHALGCFRLSVSGDADAFEREESRFAAFKVTDPWVRLAAAYRALGESEKALAALTRAIELAADDAARAAAAREAAAFDDLFAQLLARFPDTDPTPERGPLDALHLGQALYLASKHVEQHRFQAAIDLLTSALDEFPDDVELCKARAAARMKLGQWQAADQDYARVIRLEPEEERRREAERARAEIQLRMGHFEQGAECFFEDMLLSPGGFWRIRDAAVAQLLAVNHATARAAADLLLRKLPDNPEPEEAAWLVRVHAGQPGLITGENRQKLLDAAKKAGGARIESSTAAIHFRLGELDQAQALVAKAGDDRQLQALAAMLLYDQGKLDEARNLLAGVKTWLENERAQDLGSAIPNRQEWRHWSVTTAVWREAARKLIGRRIAELDASIDKLEIVKAEYGGGAVQKDVTDVLRKRLADARRASLPFSSYVSLPLSSFNAAFGDPQAGLVKRLRVEYVLTGRAAEATFAENSRVTFPLPNTSLEIGPDDAPALLERARLLADAGLYDEALSDLDRLAALKVDSPEDDALRGRLLAGLNRPDEALPHLNRAVEAGSKDAGVYCARGAIMRKQGHRDAARADFERSLELDPNQHAARSLADLLLDAPRIATPKPFVQVGQEGQPHGIVHVDTPADGATGPATRNGDDCRFIDTSRGYGHAYFAIDNDFKPAAGTDTEIEIEYWDEGAGRFEIHYDALDNPYKKSDAPVQLVDSKRWERARFILKDVRFANRQNGKADFRILAIGAPLYLKRVTIRAMIPGVDSADPWLRLAAAYALDGQTEKAVKRFAAALDDARSPEARRAIAEVASGHEAVLAILQRQRADDPLWQLALAGSLVKRGRSLLATHRSEAQAEFDKALDILAQAFSACQQIEWSVLKPTNMISAGGATLTLLPDGSILAGGQNPDQDTYTIRFQPGMSHVAAIRLETMPDDSLPERGSGRAHTGNFTITGITLHRRSAAPDGGEEAIGIRAAWVDHSDSNSGGAKDGVGGMLDANDQTYWSVYPRQKWAHLAVFQLDKAVDFTGAEELSVRLHFQHKIHKEHTLGRFRLSLTSAPHPALLHAEYAALGEMYAAAGQWPGAVGAYRSVVTMTPYDSLAWLRLAPLLVLAGDEAGYRAFCRDMVQQFRAPDDAATADKVCKACLLRADAVDLAELPVKRLREATTEPSQADIRPWLLGCCALVSYREGNARDAIGWAEQVEDSKGQHGALALVVRAMAEHQLGDTERARQTLAQASALIPVELRTLGTDAYGGPLPVAGAIVTHDWLIPEILRREANASIEPAAGNAQIGSGT